MVNIFNSSFSAYDTVYSSSVTITGLYPDMDYNARVRAMCSATTYSDWGDTIAFSTSACQPVADVTINGITATAATISWTPQGDADSWVLSYGYAGFTQGDGTDVIVSTPSYTINGLTPETLYEVYVRAACSEDVFSSWSPVQRFSTLSYTGITTVEGDVACTIYPNPADEATTISISGANGTIRITVIDMNGRTVASDEMNCSGDCTKQMTVSGLAQGAYYVRVVGDNVNMVRKLIVR